MSAPFTFTSIHKRLRMTVVPADIDHNRRKVLGKRAEFEGGKFTTSDPEIVEFIRNDGWYGVKVFETEEQARRDPRSEAQQEAVDAAADVAESTAAAPPIKPLAAPDDRLAELEQKLEAAYRLIDSLSAQAGGPAPDADPDAGEDGDPDGDAVDDLTAHDVDPDEDGFYTCPYDDCDKRLSNRGALSGHLKTHRK